MTGCKKAVFVSEVGWRGTRELSIKLDGQGVFCAVIIKGSVPKDVMSVITPYGRIGIRAVPRLLFILVVAAYTLGAIFEKGTLFVFSKESTRKNFGMLLRMSGVQPLLLIEKDSGYELFNACMEKYEISADI